MRGADISQPSLFITKTVEDFVPKEHPLRAMRKLIDQALSELDGKFERLYADEGRASIAPERLIRASLLQVLFTIRSERQLVEHIRYHEVGIVCICLGKGPLIVGLLPVVEFFAHAFAQGVDHRPDISSRKEHLE